MTLENIIPTLLQVPFVAAFIWFSLRLSHDYRKDATLRDEHWMEFLKLEREQRKLAMEQGMQEMCQITGGMVKLTESMGDLARAIAEHNVGAMERHNALRDSLRDMGC